MQDLKNLVSNSQYDDMLKINGIVQFIWILLINRRPDENSKHHLKNIKAYCQLFKKFDLDFLSIRIHASDQSKYNSVERSIATLSSKLTGIILPIDHFGIYLNTQGKVINLELAAQNFHYLEETFYEI